MNQKNTPSSRRDQRKQQNTPLFLKKSEGLGAEKNRFTLIELLVVIAIIAILAAVLLPVRFRWRMRMIWRIHSRSNSDGKNSVLRPIWSR